jgi:hypothetical protein
MTSCDRVAAGRIESDPNKAARSPLGVRVSASKRSTRDSIGEVTSSSFFVFQNATRYARGSAGARRVTERASRS